MESILNVYTYYQRAEKEFLSLTGGRADLREGLIVYAIGEGNSCIGDVAVFLGESIEEVEVIITSLKERNIVQAASEGKLELSESGREIYGVAQALEEQE